MSRLGLSPGLSFFKRSTSIGFDVESIGGTRRLRMEDFVKFLVDDLKIQPAEIKSVQIHPIAPYCFVGFSDDEKMLDHFQPIQSGVNWRGKGDVYPFLCTETYTEVKVKGVLPGTATTDIQVMLGEYGDVLSVKEFRSKVRGIGGPDGAPSGDYLVRMKLKNPIPRLLTRPEDGDMWAIFYEGQEDCCWRCFDIGHTTRDCNISLIAEFQDMQRHYKRRYNGEIVNDDAFIDDDQPEDLTGDDQAVQSPRNADNAPLPVIQINSNTIQNSQESFERAETSQGTQVIQETQSQDMFEDTEENAFYPTPGDTQLLNNVMDDVEGNETGNLTAAEKKAKKKERQREKRLNSSNSVSMSPKRNKVGVLVASPLGDLRERQRSLGSNEQPGTSVSAASIVSKTFVRPKMITPAERLRIIGENKDKSK